MRVFIAMVMAMMFVAAAYAQDLGSFEEVTAGNYFGIGARQMSMGGTGIAASMDGAALYYNPAALARIHRIEFQLGLTHQKFSNETTQPPDRYDGFTSVLDGAQTDQTKTRFGSVNLSVPVPTYRGSLVIAFGVNRVQSFDRAAMYHVMDVNGSGMLVDDYAREFESGSIYAYSAGAGIDISPNISLGLALHVYSGQDDYTYDYRYTDESNTYFESLNRRISEDYIGASLKGGILARPNSNLAVGVVVETPLNYQVEFRYDDEYGDASSPDVYYDAGIVEYDLSRPFIFGAGASFRVGTFTVTGDAEYADWSQLSYGDNPEMEKDNEILTELYRDVLNLRLGAEYQFPSAGLALRAGIFSEPLPYRKEAIVNGVLREYIENDRNGVSLGLGWLIDKVLMLETAYVHGSFDRRYAPTNAEYVNAGTDMALAKDSFSRLYFTLSYRY